MEFIRQTTGNDLKTFESTSLSIEKLTGNIENMIGSVEIPVGLAGPLWFKGQAVKEFIYAPFATTEGALVASATRGATAISRSGGVTTRVIRQQMLRVPMFILTDMNGAFLFTKWIRDHQEEISAQIGLVSCHAHLTQVEPFQIGNMVHVRFLYETGDAAGQNMTTVCTWKACQWIMEQMQHFADIVVDNFFIEANLSGDKKVNYLSFMSGRGIRVTAECFIKREILEQVLKISPQHIELCNQGFLMGSIQAGMIGYNINIANVIAAIYTATGQDIASIHESSLGQLNLQASEKGLYASLMLPSLIIGTVGGGTHLPVQQDALDIIGCTSARKVFRLAEIIAGFCLALDISTLAAIASGQFATAHDRLGRNRPVKWFGKDDLNKTFFQEPLRRFFNNDSLEVVAIEPLDFEMGSSIITQLTARKVRKLVGLYPLRINHLNLQEKSHTDVLVKVKPLDDEVILMINSMATMCGGRLASSHARYKDLTGFKNCHLRELAVYSQKDPRFIRHVPKIYHCYSNHEREAYVVVMEKLENMELLNTANSPGVWQKQHIEAALKGIAEIHAIWLGREEELKSQSWLGQYPTANLMGRMKDLWESLIFHASEEFPEIITQGEKSAIINQIKSVEIWWQEIEKMPRTLVHNDFNPRNIALRPLPDGDWRLCAYDWELATLHLPQRDLVELLSFVLLPEVKEDEILHYSEVHRKALEKSSGIKLDKKLWDRGYNLCLRDYIINRIPMYLMAHTFRNYSFMERVVKVVRRLINQTIGDFT